MKPILPRVSSALLAVLFAVPCAAPALPTAAETGPPQGHLLRYPDARGDVVVFVQGGDIWQAPVAGGAARRLTTHPGLELFPKISPDGKWIAFSAEYSGSRQVWVMPVHGGLPRQLTFYTDVGAMPPRGGWDYWIQGWTPDGKVLVRANRTPFGERMGRYFVVDPAGGLEQPLPLPEGGSASLSPDGKRLAYCPIDREFRTWKRTLGGRAQDVWIFDLAASRSDRITDWRGTDSFPMWWKDTIYFTSDRDRTLNVFAYDTRTKATRKVTSFTEFDVLWPSLGDGQIVFMNGGDVWRLPLETGKAERIPIALGADFAAAVPRFADVKSNLDGFAVSPSGARALFAARGDLFSVPAKDGATRNLTRSQGVRELSPAWSPDGKWIAYLSDQTGEYEVWVRPADGSAEARQVTKGGDTWRYDLVFSPDSRKLAVADQRRRLLVVDVASGEAAVADTSRDEHIQGYSFSPDSRWLAYQKSQTSRLPGIWVYSLEQKKAFALGNGLTSDVEPVFSKDGKYLFFLSDRDYNITFSAFEFSYLYTKATRVYAAALSPDAPALFPPKSDEESTGEEKKPADARKDEARAEKKGAKDDKGGKDGATAEKKDEKKAAEPPVVAVVPEGFVARTVALPGLKSDDYRNLQASPDGVHYLKGDDDARALYRYDLKDRKEEKVADSVRDYVLSADGKKVLFRSGADFYLTDAKSGKSSEGRLELAGLRMKLDPRAEWKQMWADAVRIGRDFFYDPKMHGFDWQALARKYEPLVSHVAHRSDLDFLLGELLSELEAGHTYVTAGDEPKVTRVPGAMLGCELTADKASGRYRISKIYAGESWDDAYRSPLAEPGVNVAEGELLLAIDGEELRADDNPYRLLEGKAGQPVVLTVAKEASPAASRKVPVRPVASELNLRYLDWVTSRMAMVEKLSGGRVGYIHLPDTATDGNRMLQKLFYSQARKPALLVDDRYNGGGFIPDRMIEMLSRKTLSWWARRDIRPFTSPGFAHDGPKAMLVNGYSSSGGDALPYYFRKNGLGPLIGTRTWGGLIGLSGGPVLVDGGAVLIPSFRIYDENGRWVVENEGVSPDIEVIDLPEARIAGRDPSLEKGVEVLLRELEKAGAAGEPKVPSPPDMPKSWPGAR